jgi:hypothetical protein
MWIAWLSQPRADYTNAHYAGTAKVCTHALPAKLIWMATSKLTLDVAIQFKLGVPNTNTTKTFVSLADKVHQEALL